MLKTLQICRSANKTDNSELEFHVYSNNKTSFERAVSKIKSWKSLKVKLTRLKLNVSMFQKLIFSKEALIKAVRETNTDALVSLKTETSEAFIYTTGDQDLTKIQSLVANFGIGASNQQDKATFTCCISNLSPERDAESWKSYFNVKGKNFGELLSCQVAINRADTKSYQCWIKYGSKESAEKASRFFGNLIICEKKLVAKSDSDELIDSDTASADTEDDEKGLLKKENVTAANFSDKIEIANSKFMKNVLSRKKKILEDEKSSTRVSIEYLSTTSYALVAEVSSNDKKLFDKAVEAIKSWRVVFKRLELKQNEFDILEKQKKIIIDKTRQIDEDVNINFNPKTRFLTVNALKKESLDAILAMVQKMLVYYNLIFVSFERKLQAYANNLHQFLMEKSYKVSDLEPVDLESSDGRSDALKNCQTAICCVSKRFVKNREFLKELKTILERGSVIILLYEDVDLSLLKINAIKNVQVIKLFDFEESRKSWTGLKADLLLKHIDDVIMEKTNFYF